MHSSVMYIMSECNPSVVRRDPGTDTVSKDILWRLYRCRGIMIEVLGINVGIYYMISESWHSLHTAVVAAVVWRSHVGWVFSDCFSKVLFHSCHLIGDFNRIHIGEILVAPWVRSNLMSFIDHTFNQRCFRGVHIDRWTKVVAVDKESYTDVILL